GADSGAGAASGALGGAGAASGALGGAATGAEAWRDGPGRDGPRE
nr:hypothetical protein [Tanacetum cinerariifolium]